MKTRPIKFRAWQGVKMHEVSSINFPTKQCPWLWGFSNENSDSLNRYQFTLMQFTGLLDRNGKEIYEGDIIVSVENNEVYAIGNMTPLDRHLDMLADNIGYFTDSNRKKFENRSSGGRYHVDDWVSWPEMYEIIGNIYENPELLKNE